jgi:hypothetical protein
MTPFNGAVDGCSRSRFAGIPPESLQTELVSASQRPRFVEFIRFQIPQQFFTIAHLDRQRIPCMMGGEASGFGLRATGKTECILTEVNVEWTRSPTSNTRFAPLPLWPRTPAAANVYGCRGRRLRAASAVCGVKRRAEAPDDLRRSTKSELVWSEKAMRNEERTGPTGVLPVVGS